jgi:hypothetical protein
VPKLTALHKLLKCKEDLKDEVRQCVTTVEGVDFSFNSVRYAASATIDDEDDVPEIFR